MKRVTAARVSQNILETSETLVYISFVDEEVLAKKVPQKLTPSKIHGLSKDKASLEEGSHNFSFLISFSDGSSKLVPREEANELCPQLVLGKADLGFAIAPFVIKVPYDLKAITSRASRLPMK